MDTDRGLRARIPVPALVALGILLLLGPVAFAAGGGHHTAPAPAGPRLAQIARDAGCTLTEFQDGMKTNPPVTGRFVERATVAMEDVRRIKSQLTSAAHQIEDVRAAVETMAERVRGHLAQIDAMVAAASEDVDD